MAYGVLSALWTATRAAVYAAAFVGFWTWLAWWAHNRDALLGLVGPAWQPDAGVVLMALGGTLALWCVLLFVVRGHGTPAPFDAPREFVATGPYRWVRNPMYLGLAVALLGYALCGGSATALGVPVLLLVAAHLFVVHYEEPALEARFGESYRAYRRATRRWLPGPPRR